MIADIKHLVHAKWFWIFFGISLAIRVTIFRFLPSNSPATFGPDEGIYASLAEHVARSLPVQDFPGFGPALYNNSRSFILPSSLLIRLGLESLEAVRIIANLYGLLSSIFIFLTILLMSQLYTSQIIYNNKIKLIILFFLFLPSNFLWSTIGLRESASQFWLIATFYFLMRCRSAKNRLIYVIASALSLGLAFGTRKETALVFAIVSLFVCVVFAEKTKKLGLSISIILGIMFGQLITTTPAVDARENFVLSKLPSNSAASPAPSSDGGSEPSAPSSDGGSEPSAPRSDGGSEPSAPSSDGGSEPSAPSSDGGSEPSIPQFDSQKSACVTQGQILELPEGKYICQSEKSYEVKTINPLADAASQVQRIVELDKVRNARTVNARSALPESGCEVTGKPTSGIILCNLQELAYRLPSFLFRPFFYIDSGNDFILLASVENLAWVFFFVQATYLSFKSRKRRPEGWLFYWLWSYIILFSTAAALYEGNIGTAFRHKSSILWPIVLIFGLNQVHRHQSLAKS